MNKKACSLFLCVCLFLIMSGKLYLQLAQEEQERKIEEQIFAARKKMFGMAEEK